MHIFIVVLFFNVAQIGWIDYFFLFCCEIKPSYFWQILVLSLQLISVRLWFKISQVRRTHWEYLSLDVWLMETAGKCENCFVLMFSLRQWWFFLALLPILSPIKCWWSFLLCLSWIAALALLAGTNESYCWITMVLQFISDCFVSFFVMFLVGTYRNQGPVRLRCIVFVV